MSNWIETLKVKIDTIKDNDWNEECIVASEGKSFRLKSARIVVPMSRNEAWQFLRFPSCVNSTEVAGISPEKLMIESMETTGDGKGHVAFLLRNAVPWTHLLGHDGKFRRFSDSADQPIFAMCDFNLIQPPEDHAALRP